MAKMTEKNKKRLLALCGAICGAEYLSANHIWPGASDFIMGALLGLALTLIVMSLLPETLRQKRKRMKGRENCG